jgi:glycosyltransferase involved in cell wall biosynthesis
MTPPVIACLPVWLYAKLTNATYVIDAHTAAFVTPPWNRILRLHAFFSRRAVTTTVTNGYLESIVRAWSARAMILADVPVHFPAPTSFSTGDGCNMTFVSSFTPDEPLDLFLRAAQKLPDIQFFVTGNYKDGDERVLLSKPQNVKFTGYLSDSDYVGLLLASDAVISLTKEDHTMQRGAYEAVYLEKPVVTSNFEVLRKAFRLGAVHVDNNVEDIARGIMQMRDNIEKYEKEVRKLRLEKLQQWKRVETELGDLLLGYRTRELIPCSHGGDSDRSP